MRYNGSILQKEAVYFMKKTFGILNAITITVAAVAFILYRNGAVSKGVASFGFVLIGIVNLIYALQCKKQALRFPSLMASGLLFCMLGDVVIDLNFIIGAAIFALGHVFYCVAYTGLDRFKAKDLIPICLFFTASTLLITLAPIFHFDSPVLQIVCIVYALIISCMVGKAIMNCIDKPNIARSIMLIGSCLFFFSDLMLVFDWFAGVSIAGPICLGTYYPAQYLLAFSVYCYINKEA